MASGKPQKSRRKISLPWFRQGSFTPPHQQLTRQHTIDTPSSFQARLLQRQPSQSQVCVCLWRFTRKANENGISLPQVFLYPSLMIEKDVKGNGCGLILGTSTEFPLFNLRKKNIEDSPSTSWYLNPGRPEFVAGCLLITRLWFLIGWNMKTVWPVSCNGLFNVDRNMLMSLTVHKFWF